MRSHLLTNSLFDRSPWALAVAALLATAQLELVLAPAQAQSTPFDQSGDRTGWWGSRRSPLPDEPRRATIDAADREAAHLYAEARRDMDATRNSQAQRKLEILVAKYPVSPLADVARRDIQRLYAASGPVPATIPTAQPLRTIPIAPAVDGSAVAARPNTSLPLAYSVRQASEDFRQHAGDRLFFADGSTDMGARGHVALAAQARWLARYPEIQITIAGHADDAGGDDANIRLSEQRAKAVKLRLNDLGVTASRVSVVAHGRDQLISSCAEPSCALQNRRVVTTITSVPVGIGFDPPQQQVGRQLIGQPPGVSTVDGIQPRR